MKLSDSIITAISAFRHPEKRATIQLARSLKGKRGIEIGGPSNFFKQKSYFPVYLYAATIDGVNYSADTVWEGKIAAGKTYKYLAGYPKGHQFITEAVMLDGIQKEQYDFLLSCHNLEHIANPLKALLRWHDILKPGGLLVLVLPNKAITFDKNRPYTKFSHLKEDFEKNVGEDDSTHFEEIFQHHIIEKDTGATTPEELKARTMNNFVNRCVHHHVYSFQLIREMLEYANFEVMLQKEIHTLNLFTIAKKR